MGQMPLRSHRYTSVAITLHWVMAFLLVGMIFAGWYMGDLKDALLEGRALIGAVGYDGPDEAALKAMGGRVEWLYQLHKSIGITILLLTVARISWRAMNPPPRLPSDMPALEKTASHLVHMGFYGLMIAIPLTGWLMVSLPHEFQVPTVLFGAISWPKLPFVGGLDGAYAVVYFIHGKMGWLLLGLLALHVIGALKHEIQDEEGVLKRMIPGLFGKTAGPQMPGKGAFVALANAALLFGAVLVIPMIANAFQGAPEQAEAAVLAEANWDVDQAASTITFSGAHDGNDFTGSFENWTASIGFDENNLSTARASVTVDTGSAVTNKKLYTDSLKAAEWFDVKVFPQATVDLTNFRRDGDGYIADASLTLKDQTVTVPFVFDLTIEGDTANMNGEAVLQRTPLTLGQDSDPGADWVSEDVTVTVTVSATRK